MSTGVGHFGAKFGEGLTDLSQILAQSGRDMVLSYAGQILSYILLSERNAGMWQTGRQIDKQADKPCNGNIDRSRHQRCQLIISNDLYSN